MLRAGRVTIKVDQAQAQRVATDYAFVLVTDTTRQIFNRASVLTPVRFGNLRGHNKQRVKRRSPGVVGEVYNDADYAEAVHNGSRAHTIRPKREQSKRNKKRKAMLRFVVGGRVVFARSVRHPGTRARPWLARAAEEVARKEGFRWQANR